MRSGWLTPWPRAPPSRLRGEEVLVLMVYSAVRLTVPRDVRLHFLPP